MNGTRYKAATTPEARIAARVRKALYEIEEKNRQNGHAVIADYHELEHAIRAEVRKEVVSALLSHIKGILENPAVKEHEELHRVFMRMEQVLYQELVKLEETIQNHMK